MTTIDGRVGKPGRPDESEDEMPVTDRAAAKARLRATFTDETVQPDGYVAMRCTDHGRFVVWVWDSVPDCRVDCPAACGAGDRSGAFGLRETSGRPA